MWLVFLLFLLKFGRTYGKDYKVIVETSTEYFAGTDATVKIKIFGTLGNMAERELDGDFERGDTDEFTLSDYDRGYVTGMQLWRNHPKIGSDWHVKQVTIQVSGAADSVFYYNDWLGTGWTTLTLSCTGGNEVNEQGYCSDKYTCSQSNPCKDPKATCEAGTSRCRCPAGYESPNNAVSDMCQDIDECTKQNDQCQHNCHNNVGSYTCSCKEGYELNDPYACVDKDECLNPSTCTAPSQCVDTEGSFECRCPSGYTKKPNTLDECEDVDECAGSNNCDDRKSTCQNNGGSYTCLCNGGYKNDLVNPLLCIDIDECSSGLHTCNSTSSSCINSEGGFACQCRDGFYQGSTNKICLPLKCVSLSAPVDSTLEPDRCTQENANSFGDRCTMRCNEGYIKSNVGNGYLTCGVGGIWEGSLGSCEPVKCPKLTADPNGGLWPGTCATTGAEYPEYCSYSCNNGYTMSGQGRRNCQIDGTWDGFPPTCTKIVVVPSITCPSNIIQDLAPGKSTADVSGVWKEPTSSEAQITVQPPEITSAYQFPLGTTKVEWTATNSAGSESCAIYVVISDKEAPAVVTCPVDIYIKSTVKPAVTWAEPIFNDNVNVTSVQKSYSSGEVFDFGTTSVKYDAEDASGNRVSCTFKVIIERPICAFPNPPDSGNVSCSRVGNSAFCSALCQSGSHVYNASSAFWLCDDGIWKPSDVIPDCVVASEKVGDTPCEEGRAEVNITSFGGQKLYCAKCPKGTYALQGKCNPCPVGMYNSLQGQTSCTDCPAGTSSLEGTKYIADCLQPCPAGKYSSNGLGPNCHVCPSDTFQNKPMQTNCEPCPNGTYTISPGTESQDGCGVKPSVTNILPVFASINEGESKMFFCYATGIPTPTYKWTFTDNSVPPEFLGTLSQAQLTDGSGNVIGASLTITDATVKNTGSYECKATNTHGQDMKLAQIYVAPVIDVGSGA